MQLPENPFTFSPVRRELFAGRKDAIALVQKTCLEAKKRGESKIIVITGPRAIGKTSFLNLIRTSTNVEQEEELE